MVTMAVLLIAWEAYAKFQSGLFNHVFFPCENNNIVI